MATYIDKAELKPVAGSTVFPVVKLPNDYPKVTVQITGHLCWLKTSECDLDRSQRRADTVADCLISQGIDGDRLFIAAEGGSQPIYTNLTEEGRRAIVGSRWSALRGCKPCGVPSI